MTTRRDFLKGAATGIVFCSCGMLDAARAQAQGPRRLPVVVDGKRIKTIDAHTHCFDRRPPTAASQRAPAQVEPLRNFLGEVIEMARPQRRAGQRHRIWIPLEPGVVVRD